MTTIYCSPYEYRYVTVRGLERKPNVLTKGFFGGVEFSPVTGDDFLQMDWRELEHVSHVIRKALSQEVAAA